MALGEALVTVAEPRILPLVSCIEILIVVVLADMRGLIPATGETGRVGNTAEKLIPEAPGIPAVDEPNPVVPAGELAPQPESKALNMNNAIIVSNIFVLIV